MLINQLGPMTVASIPGGRAFSYQAHFQCWSCFLYDPTVCSCGVVQVFTLTVLSLLQCQHPLTSPVCILPHLFWGGLGFVVNKILGLRKLWGSGGGKIVYSGFVVVLTKTRAFFTLPTHFESSKQSHTCPERAAPSGQQTHTEH